VAFWAQFGRAKAGFSTSQNRPQPGNATPLEMTKLKSHLVLNLAGCLPHLLQ
jgi:hypothetical protein